ncbi:alpha/beta fold hydrolase [Endozoicomonas sp. SM1973]|uniref:Alpha/beta fold hydrolase n=1 Tax=Spartinivicinus marinus TaxID=2994442 RepID=A0A853I6Q3_9GAMM|nr:alpha/beta fold hydrolase [Spartinivicinus marinus]MCX4027480.1 alpha/beta fold hydrolase [Spartinivicinus marinus]NYZ66348.1 alpha/beta fold hydrolase [Spartinivicinus marinus]
MLKLHHKVLGAGEPLILVHGLFGSLENLGGIAKILAEQFMVYSLDMRNHGRSPHSDRMDHQLMAGDIAHFMDENGIKRAHLLGHSMGGKAVMQLALTNPQYVNKLIVADIAPIKYTARHSDVFAGLQAINPKAIKSRIEADKILQEHIKELPVRSFLLKNLVKNAETGFTWRMNLAALHNQYENIIDGQTFDKPHNGDVLFIKGGNSDYLLPKHREEIITMFPNAQVREIPNTGHWLHAEKPELFCRIVERFLGIN